MNDHADAELAARGSSALALRSPAALRRGPSFYPTGHADGTKVFTVAFGAPMAVATGFGLLGAALGSGALGTGIGVLLAPFASLAANHWYQDRGKGRLQAARKLFLTDPERGLVALQAVVDSNALPEIRLEAAARLALDALERGEVAQAIERLNVHEQDLGTLRRRRSWEAGLRAEVLRAILAWLAPDSFTEVGIVRYEEFDGDSADEEGAALLAVLRVLERSSEPDNRALASAWADAASCGLEHESPALYIVALAVAAERLPELIDQLHDRLQEDTNGTYRALLRRLFPRMQLLGEGGYRQMTTEDPADASTALAVVVPPELATRAEPTNAELVPVSRGNVALSFLSAYGLVIGTSMLLSAVVSGTAVGLGVGAAIGFMMSIYLGTPLGAIWGSRRIQRLERQRRIGPLSRLLPTPAEPWLTECACGPPGPLTRSSGYRRLTELPPSQMALYVAAFEAEQAIGAGNPAKAWEQLQWWFAGFSGRLVETDAMYVVGSTLVRVAALSGRQAIARRLLMVVPEVGNDWDDRKSRTAYGNAPTALALAGALVAAIDEDWERAAAALRRARGGRAVYIAAHDHVLIAEVDRRCRAAGQSTGWVVPKDIPSNPRWLDDVWPKGEPAALPNA